MGLSKYKLGDLIQESLRKNDDLIFDVSFVRGISNNKQIVETKATALLPTGVYFGRCKNQTGNRAYSV